MDEMLKLMRNLGSCNMDSIAIGDFEDGPFKQGDYGYVTLQYQRIEDAVCIREYMEVIRYNGSAEY